MGITTSSYMTFALGSYWIGKPRISAKRGLQLHFPSKMVKSVSLTDLQNGNDDIEKHTLLIVYDKDTDLTLNVLRV
jgi:hypothetical protein